jgi:hypothetical protein
MGSYAGLEPSRKDDEKWRLRFVVVPSAQLRFDFEVMPKPEA